MWRMPDHNLSLSPLSSISLAEQPGEAHLLSCPALMAGRHQGEGIIEMRDEMDGRLWAEHGREFSDFVGRVVDKLADVFAEMSRVQFDAPWRAQPKREH
jgi:hypothetical protein